MPLRIGNSSFWIKVTMVGSRTVVYLGRSRTECTSIYFRLQLLYHLNSGTLIKHCLMISRAVDALFCEWLKVLWIVIWWWTFTANFIVARLSKVNGQVVIICGAPIIKLFFVRRRSLVLMESYNPRWLAKTVHQHTVFKALICHSNFNTFNFYVIAHCALRNCWFFRH